LRKEDIVANPETTLQAMNFMANANIATAAAQPIVPPGPAEAVDDLPSLNQFFEVTILELF
jgi:hypothetical protein